jgi:tetratricopeptide (TPR) repeat protein
MHAPLLKLPTASAVIALVGLAAYANSFDVPLQFDDLPNIVEATALHATDLSPAQLARAAGGFPLHRWLAMVSFAANHAVHGLRPFGYHVVNLLFHVGAALLLHAVALRLLESLSFGDDRARRSAALVAALLFVAHPVNTQAVTYVVQRMTSMGTFFALLSILLWQVARARSGPSSPPLYAGALLAFLLALGCKENFVVVPLLVLFIEWLVNPRFTQTLRANWRWWAPAAFLAALAGAAAAWAYSGVIASEHARFGIPLHDRLLSQGRILVHYLSLVALPLPSRMHVDYAWPPSTGLLSPPSTIFSLAAIAAGSVWALIQRQRFPLVALAAGWFLIGLSVEQSVLPIDLVFEHRLYFAALGIFVLAGAAAVRLIRIPTLGVWPLAAPVVALLALGTHARNEQWREPTLLYASTGTEGPGAVRNLLSLSVAHRDRGEFDLAERALRRAIELAPREPEAYADMGSLELARGRPESAERWLRMAIDRNMGIATVWHNLGSSLERQSRPDEAMSAYERALQLNPSHPQTRTLWALLAYRRGDKGAARAAVDEAIALDPADAFALTVRAQLRMAGGDTPGAEADARAAVRMAPEIPHPHEVLVRVLVRQGRLDEARSAARALQHLDPANAVAAGVLQGSR